MASTMWRSIPLGTVHSPARVTKRFACGMLKVEDAFKYSKVIRITFIPSCGVPTNAESSPAHETSVFGMSRAGAASVPSATTHATSSEDWRGARISAGHCRRRTMAWYACGMSKPVAVFACSKGMRPVLSRSRGVSMNAEPIHATGTEGSEPGTLREEREVEDSGPL